MKVKLDYDKLKAYAIPKGVKKLSVLCREAKVNYYTILNNRYKDSDISIANAYLLSQYLGCTINDIIKVEDAV